jgi:hypothetical protein
VIPRPDVRPLRFSSTEAVRDGDIAITEGAVAGIGYAVADASPEAGGQVLIGS